MRVWPQMVARVTRDLDWFGREEALRPVWGAARVAHAGSVVEVTEEREREPVPSLSGVP